MQDSTPLLGLRNIGPTIAARLEAVNIRTVGDLKAIGPAQAYRRVRENNPGVTIPVCYYLYALQGALDDVHWAALSAEMKQKLLSAVQALQTP